jgi:thiosulfate/3-mercaptopyruvate sulfurtransferase
VSASLKERKKVAHDYAHPETIVSTDWTQANADQKGVRIVEVDVDANAYDEGHIPGAVGWDWSTELSDTLRRDILPRGQFEALMRKSGIAKDTTVILYGDNNNWFAAWAFWQMKIYGHEDVRLMDGGRKKWLAEGRPLTTHKPEVKSAAYRAPRADLSIRAFLPAVQEGVKSNAIELIDVHSPKEYSGEMLAPPGLPETCQRGGHIPTAENVPWGVACEDDGTFKSREALEEIYRSAGVTGDKPVVAYCRIGERSSHTWFVLRYLLGLENVANYDGSWTEWGNLVGAPVERGATA